MESKPKPKLIVFDLGKLLELIYIIYKSIRLPCKLEIGFSALNIFFFLYLLFHYLINEWVIYIY